MKKFVHKLKHIFKTYHGYCDAFYRGKKMYMSYKCSECGKREGIFPIDNLVDDLLKD